MWRPGCPFSRCHLYRKPFRWFLPRQLSNFEPTNAHWQRVNDHEEETKFAQLIVAVKKSIQSNVDTPLFLGKAQVRVCCSCVFVDLEFATFCLYALWSHRAKSKNWLPIRKEVFLSCLSRVLSVDWCISILHLVIKKRKASDVITIEHLERVSLGVNLTKLIFSRTEDLTKKAVRYMLSMFSWYASCRVMTTINLLLLCLGLTLLWK